MSDTNPSIATGAELTPDTWDDFLTRLRYDCVGDGVKSHYTANAIFVVQTEKILTGFDPLYGGERLVCDDEGIKCFTPEDYYDSLDTEEAIELYYNPQRYDEYADQSEFIDWDEDDQWNAIADIDGLEVVYYVRRWEHVNTHFTQDAADAFIKRKKHDYGKMRVYVDSQSHCWEYNTIKKAILDGQLIYQGKEDK
jgi:hypothetical protein